jgi:hypothetical protein
VTPLLTFAAFACRVFMLGFAVFVALGVQLALRHSALKSDLDSVAAQQQALVIRFSKEAP